MKKKQKINKAVNYGEWLLLGLTALFLLFLFLIRDRPAPARGVGVRTSATRAPASAIPDAAASQDVASNDGDASDVPDAAPNNDSDGASESVSASAPAHDDSGRVNINTAGLSELCALPGIGESLAGRIIDYREQFGPFARPEDIMRVAGIGQGKFSAMKDLIAV